MAYLVLAVLALVLAVALRRWWRRRPTTTPAVGPRRHYEGPAGVVVELALVAVRGKLITGVHATVSGEAELVLVRDTWGARREIASCAGVGRLAITGLAELVEGGSTYSAVIRASERPAVHGVALDMKGA